MSNIECYKLHFKAPLHLGIEGPMQERIHDMLHSDTLCGAIINCWIELWGEFNFNKSGFMVSSAFPFVKDQFFFPTPLDISASFSSDFDSVNNIIKYKKLLKTKFISQTFFEKYLTGKICQGDIGLIEEPDYGKRDSRPRVSVDRYTSEVFDDGFFHTVDWWFKDDSGLFFLAVFETQEIKEKFDCALRLLGDTGIGGDRSIGKGFFCFENKPFESDKIKIDCENSEQKILLSLFHPSKTDIEQEILKNSEFKLIPRFGNIAHISAAGKRRKTINMIEEGSVIKGKIENAVSFIPIAEEFFTIYRYVKGFFISKKVNYAEK